MALSNKEDKAFKEPIGDALKHSSDMKHYLSFPKATRSSCIEKR